VSTSFALKARIIKSKINNVAFMGGGLDAGLFGIIISCLAVIPVCSCLVSTNEN